MTSIEFAIEPTIMECKCVCVCLYSAFMTTANMKYRANIKNDNKNMKSICKWNIRTMQNIQSESKWVKSNGRNVDEWETKNRITIRSAV